MLFNSLDFALFLPIVFALYWGLLSQRTKGQNILIVVASYVFYGWWDWRFLTLIIFSTLLDFSLGLGIKKVQRLSRKKLLLWCSIAVNLGFLGVFKYFNFFLENFKTAFSWFGSEIQTDLLHIVLPVGISFYTFQTLSYTIDVYRGKLEPTNDLVAFSAFVCFFPQLVAGPIERATHLLPQFHTSRRFHYSAAVSGMKQILWGLFKKVVIADNCAAIANTIFNDSADYSGSSLLLGALLFSFQIYGDFSGYSDIAIGTSRLFGFDLKKNFAFPYFSRDIAEFWRKWHISLSTWFRDYVYIPLGGSKGGRGMQIRNTFIIFLVSGFWHGANWTFIVWGALNALYFLPLMLRQKNRNHMGLVAEGKTLPSLKECFSILFTFTLTVFAWVFFRADNVSHALDILWVIFSSSIFTSPSPDIWLLGGKTTLLLIIFFMSIEWLGREGEYGIERIDFAWSKTAKILWYCSIVFTIAYFGNFSDNQFIYFQF